jgi:hypothetical protein
MGQRSEDPYRGWEQWRHRNDPPPPAPPEPRDPLAYRVPLLLAVVGVVIMLGASYLLEGKYDTTEKAHIIGFILLLDVPLTIVGLQVLGRLFKISYGPVASAIVKLVGLAVFLEGLVFAGSLLTSPITVHLLLVPVSWLLFARLFDLDGRELLYSLVGLWMFHLLLWTVFWLTYATFVLREQEEGQGRGAEVVAVWKEENSLLAWVNLVQRVHRPGPPHSTFPAT